MKCLVSGASGFIGRALCLRLTEAGHSVLPLSRCGAALPGGELTQAIDLATETVPAACFADRDTVVHLAGVAHQNAPEQAYQAINHEATMRLASAAAAAGIRHFIFVSSVKAMGAPMSGAPRCESDCQLPQDPYGLSKWQAEEALLKEYSGAMSVSIVRPALVYGAAAKGNLQRLALGVRWGLPRPPDVGRRSMIALDDLVELLLSLVSTPPGGLHTLIAAGNEAYSARDMYDALCTARGKAPGRGWLPLSAWRFAAGLLDRAAREPVGSTFEKLFGVELYDNSAARSCTGWLPQCTLPEVVGSLYGANQ